MGRPLAWRWGQCTVRMRGLSSLGCRYSHPQTADDLAGNLAQGVLDGNLVDAHLLRDDGAPTADRFGLASLCHLQSADLLLDKAGR